MLISTLAQAAPTVHHYLVRPSYWPTRADFITWCQHLDPITGAVLIMGGVFFLFSGFKMHRGLIGMTAAVIGAYAGAGMAVAYGFPLLAGIPLGAILFGVLGFYFTASAAALLGAICGAMIGASIWMMSNLDPRFTWSGALTGAVALGLLCFIIFRMSVMLFTSSQGAVMLTLGVLGLAYQYDFARPTLEQSVNAYPFVLPATIMGLIVLGLGYQYLNGPGGGGKKAAPAPASSSSKPAEKKEKSKDKE